MNDYSRPVVFSRAALQRLVVAWENEGRIEVANELRARLLMGRELENLADNLLGELHETRSRGAQKAHATLGHNIRAAAR